MQRNDLFLLVLGVALVSVGITGMVLDLLSWRSYKRTADLVRGKGKVGVNSPEDVINLIIAEAKKIGMTPKRVVVGKNSASVDFNESQGPLEQSKE